MRRWEKRIEVVAAYVKGRGSFRELEREYGISAATLHRRVREDGTGKKRERRVVRTGKEEVSYGEGKLSGKESSKLYGELTNIFKVAFEHIPIEFEAKEFAGDFLGKLQSDIKKTGGKFHANDN